jgi:peptidyl-prolyl cis-trans isomerase C
MNSTLFPDLIVNGETVPHTVIAVEAQNHAAPKSKPGIAWRKAANALAVRMLLLQEARRRGLEPQPAEVGPGRFETEEEALIRGLLEATINVTPPSEDELRAQWACDYSRFRSPPLWEVSHILCACDPRDEVGKSAARARADALLGKALGYPHSFAKLAQENSDCLSNSSGGALGQLGPGETVPEFEAALRTLSDGEITAEPVLTRHGWHIIRMDAFTEGAALPFEAVRQKISDAVEKASWAREARALVNQLFASAEISGADLQSV